MNKFIETKLFKDIEFILSKGKFYPIFMYGHKGLGKTHTIQEVCKKLGRDFVTFQITDGMIGSDYIGSLGIQNHQTVFTESKIIDAMRNGSVLILDEIDKADPSIMELQAVLNGDPVLIKKTGETVVPKQGFTVVATANTAGRGDNEMYVTSKILDSALLDRFIEMFHVSFPSEEEEKAIINSQNSGMNEEQISCLVKFCNFLRVKFNEGAIEDFISPRGAIFISKIFEVHQDFKIAFFKYIQRFPTPMQEAIKEYIKLDDSYNLLSDVIPDSDDDLLISKVSPDNPYGNMVNKKV